MTEFRVYDTIKKRYLSQEEFKCLQSAYYSTPKHTLRFGSKAQLFEVSSGLHDANGVLIYLNDNVRVVMNGRPILALVCMIYGGLCLVYTHEKTSFHHYLGSLTREEIESLEVVGTVHDTHHYLGKTKCGTCDDTGWVCEAHDNLPFEGLSYVGCKCGGAGMPCPKCNVEEKI